MGLGRDAVGEGKEEGNITFKGMETKSASLHVGSPAFHEEIRSRRVKTEVIKGEGDQLMDSVEG